MVKVKGSEGRAGFRKMGVKERNRKKERKSLVEIGRGQRGEKQ